MCLLYDTYIWYNYNLLCLSKKVLIRYRTETTYILLVFLDINTTIIGYRVLQEVLAEPVKPSH